MDNLLETVLKAVSERKAEDIRVYDMRDVTPLIDEMVIASTSNVRQNNAVVQNLKDRLYENGYEGDFRVEGSKESRWILVDLGDIVVNLFVDDERDVYGLDRLYADVPWQAYDL